MGRRLAGVEAWVWISGLATVLLLLGPALGPGALMNLDLLAFDRLPVPSGMWGLGPELPRRVPLWAFVAWFGTVVGADTAAKVLLVVMLVLAFVGAYRVTARALSQSSTNGSDRPLPDTAIALGGAVLYGAGPFILTRAAVGHWPVVLVAALLPWALPDLVDPTRPLRRIAAWALLFSLGGVYGGVIGGAFLLAALVRSGPGRAARLVGLWLAAQLVWLVPLLLVTVTTSGRTLAPSDAFATPLGEIGDVGRLLAGMGFWNLGFQLGREQPLLAACVGFAVAALAAVGTRDIPVLMRRPLLVIAMVSLAIALASGVAPFDRVFLDVTGSTLGAPLRESQRNLVPFLLWVAIAAPLGARRIGRSLPAALGAPVSLAPLVLGVVLIVPSGWGLGGQLVPVEVPEAWAQARAAIESEPGTVMALPWFQYYTSDVADDRLVLSPLPLYLGGDVVTASDPQLTEAVAQEVADGREPELAAVVGQLRAGVPSSSDLAALGVRWVASLHDVDWRSYTGLDADPGLDVVVDSDDITLFRVRDWMGQVVEDGGEKVASDSFVGPFLSVDRSGPAVYSAPYQWGWARGTSLASETEDGRVALPGGTGVVWYPPVLAVLVADAIWLGLLSWVIIGGIRDRRERGRGGR